MTKRKNVLLKTGKTTVHTKKTTVKTKNVVFCLKRSMIFVYETDIPWGMKAERER